MRRCFCFLLILFSSAGLAQVSIEQFEKWISEGNLPEVEKNIQAFQNSHPQHPSVLYATGLLQKDAERSLSYFHKLVQNAPHSAFADEALLRIGQYYYVKRNFVLARKYFSLLARSYQQSHIRDDAQYLLCQSIIAQGKTDSAKIFLQTFINNAEPSPFTELASSDLQEISRLSGYNDAANDESSAITSDTPYFTIQVGAFIQKNNARNLSKQLKKLGYPIEVFEKYREGITWYLVLVGQFRSRDEAKNAAQMDLKDEVKEYRIVERIPIH